MTEEVWIVLNDVRFRIGPEMNLEAIKANPAAYAMSIIKDFEFQVTFAQLMADAIVKQIASVSNPNNLKEALCSPQYSLRSCARRFSIMLSMTHQRRATTKAC
jgi:hypothetical protein